MQREREMLGVSFRTRSLSGTDYVMAKWSREGEGGQNKREREGETGPCMAFPLSSTRNSLLQELLPHSVFTYLPLLRALSGHFLSHSDFTRTVTLSSCLPSSF